MKRLPPEFGHAAIGATLAAVFGLSGACRPIPAEADFGRRADTGVDASADAGLPTCGNGACAGGESVVTCPDDCAVPNRHLAGPCTPLRGPSACPPDYRCVARSAAGGGPTCVAEFRTWPAQPLGHPLGSLVQQDDRVTDLATGFEWLAQPTAPMTNTDARLVCVGLTVGGHSDWRLPTRAELYSLVDFDRAGLMSWAPGMGWNPDVICHWSGTPAADGSGHWMVNFFGGNSVVWPDEQLCVVRCVRGGPTALSLRPEVPVWAIVSTEPPAVLDRRTGHLWGRQAPTPIPDPDAHAWCGSPLAADGKEGWRLPSVRELLDLLDLSRQLPSADPLLGFDLSQGTRFATSTPVAPETALWRVDFATGELRSLPTDGQAAVAVRCIR